MFHMPADALTCISSVNNVEVFNSNTFCFIKKIPKIYKFQMFGRTLKASLVKDNGRSSDYITK